jgi:hypothetical protein
LLVQLNGVELPTLTQHDASAITHHAKLVSLSTLWPSAILQVEEEQTLDTSKAKNAMAALAAAQQASREEQRRRWVPDDLVDVNASHKQRSMQLVVSVLSSCEVVGCGVWQGTRLEHLPQLQLMHNST